MKNDEDMYGCMVRRWNLEKEWREQNDAVTRAAFNTANPSQLWKKVRNVYSKRKIN